MLHLQTSPLLFNPAFHPPHTNKPADNDPLRALIYPRKPGQKDLKLADNQTNRYKCTDRQILDRLLWCRRFLANVKCNACFWLVFLFWQCLLDHILELALFTPNHPQCNTSLLLKVRRTPDASFPLISTLFACVPPGNLRAVWIWRIKNVSRQQN